jgi:glutamyl-tRNA synthetase
VTVRVRFAPSPTGFLHVGGARTALFNWLWARHNGGKFILRIEDTDADRNSDASVDQILESMQWLGLDWDEGPVFQSQRGEHYRNALETLIAKGFAYRAFETPEELDAEREKARAENRDWVYDGPSRHMSEEEAKARAAQGVPFMWRFRTPPGKTAVPETLRGGASDCTFENDRIGDFPLTRSGTEDNWGAPLYNFCCAVDDGDMAITHVIRAQEHLTNTPRQMMILHALGYEIPQYTHLPLVMKNNKKMSKRDGDADPRFPVSVSARRALGYLPEATVNFIALLGWALDGEKEIFSREELVKAFTLEGLSKANANFDEDKYLHVNGLYLRSLPEDEVVKRVLPFLAEAGLPIEGRDPKWLHDIIRLEIERCRLLSDFAPALEYYFKAPEAYEAKGVKKVFGAEGVAEILRAAAEWLAQSKGAGHDQLEEGMRALSEKLGVGFGKVAQPTRLALTGRTASPGLFDVILGIGAEESARRLVVAAERIETGSIREA